MLEERSTIRADYLTEMNRDPLHPTSRQVKGRKWRYRSTLASLSIVPLQARDLLSTSIPMEARSAKPAAAARVPPQTLPV